MSDTNPTVTDVRTALIRETADYTERRRAHHAAMRATAPELRENNPTFNARFDAYEGLAIAGARSQLIAAMLRTVAIRDPETADELAALVHEVMENGDDALDGPNDDIWAAIEAETAAKSAIACTAEVSDHTCTCLTGEPTA